MSSVDAFPGVVNLVQLGPSLCQLLLEGEEGAIANRLFVADALPKNALHDVPITLGFQQVYP